MNTQGFIGGKVPPGYPQAADDATMQLAEMLIKRKTEFISDQLEKMGYGKDCLRRYPHNFIPVQFQLVSNDLLAVVVDAATEKVLFAFTQQEKHTLHEQEGCNEYMWEVTFELEDANDLGEDVRKEAVETARQASEQLLDMRVIRASEEQK